jgi:uncharacterized protein YqeY
MSIISQIKKDRMTARRDAGKLSGFLSFVVAELEKIGKNKGNRETTDEEAVAGIKSLIKKSNGMMLFDKASAEFEVHALEKYLPTMATDIEILQVIREDVLTGETNKGKLLGKIRKTLGQNVDMNAAAAIVNHLLDKPEPTRT